MPTLHWQNQRGKAEVLTVKCCVLVWFGAEVRGLFFGVSKESQKRRRKDRWSVTSDLCYNITTTFFVYKFVDIRLFFVFEKKMKNHKMKSEDFDPHAACTFVVTSNTKIM